MGVLTELDQKTEALHVENVKSSISTGTNEHLEELDTIERTQSGKFAWLVAATAGVGGLLFGMCKSLPIWPSGY
jgi:SP family myo-inositol transporter-like MFS transporter 13